MVTKTTKNAHRVNVSNTKIKYATPVPLGGVKPSFGSVKMAATPQGNAGTLVSKMGQMLNNMFDLVGTEL